MKNFVQKGNSLTLTAPYDRLAGEGALVGTVFGVAANDVLFGADSVFQVKGVFELTKATGAITQGAKMYWDDTAKNVTTTSTNNTAIGYAVRAQSSGDTKARVNLMYL